MVFPLPGRADVIGNDLLEGAGELGEGCAPDVAAVTLVEAGLTLAAAVVGVASALPISPSEPDLARQSFTSELW